MYWIALKMLVGDKAKFLGIVMGLTFAAALHHSAGIDLLRVDAAYLRQISDITGADLWVMEPSVRFVDDIKPLLKSSLQRVRGSRGSSGRSRSTRGMPGPSSSSILHR